MWQLDYFAKRMTEIREQYDKFQRQLKMDRKEWVAEINRESSGVWPYTEGSFYPAMLGRAGGLISTLVGNYDSNYPDVKEEVVKMESRLESYDELFDSLGLDDDDLRKLKVLASRGSHSDRSRLVDAVRRALGEVDDIEYEDAVKAVSDVFTEDEWSGGERWTRGDSERVTLNSKRSEFIFELGPDVKVLKYHEVPAFCETLKEAGAVIVAG